MRKLIVLMVVSMSMVTFAQQTQPAPKEQKIIFGEEDIIDGTLARPDVEYFKAGSHALQPSLIKVRLEFKEKVMQSVGEL